MIAADATPEEVLDVAVEYTFPASDPIAIEDAYRKRTQSNSSAPEMKTAAVGQPFLP